MLADEFPEMEVRSPQSLRGTPVHLMVYPPDVDSTAALGAAAGLEQVRPIADQFYGDRSGTFRDSFGPAWTLDGHEEDVAPEEMAGRAAAACHLGERPAPFRGQDTRAAQPGMRASGRIRWTWKSRSTPMSA
jgi:PhnB protein